jgi:hypothetical protein
LRRDALHSCRKCISSKQQFPDFAFDRWEATDGKRLAVLTYTLDAAHSGYWLYCPRFAAAHRVFVYADPQRGAVRRIITHGVLNKMYLPSSAARSNRRNRTGEDL